MSLDELEKVSSVEFDQLKREVNSLIHFRDQVLASFPFISNHIPPSDKNYSYVSKRDNTSQTTKEYIPNATDKETDEDSDILLYLLDTIHKRSLQLRDKVCVLNHKKSESKDSLVSTEELSLSVVSNILNESSPVKLKRELLIQLASTGKLVSKFWDHVKLLEAENSELRHELKKRNSEIQQKNHSAQCESFFSSPFSPASSLDGPLEKYKLKSRNRNSVNESIVLAIDSTCSVMNHERSGIFPEIKSIGSKKVDQVEETSSTESSSGRKTKKTYVSENLSKGFLVPVSSESKNPFLVSAFNK